MGIVNVTPDSFSDGGRYLSTKAALDFARRLIEEGADLLDIGGESTRPGATPVTADVELERVIPVIEGLRGATVPISVDTSKPEVMRAAVAAGVQMVNDVDALTHPETMEVIASSSVAVCVMHRQGTPQNMQVRPQYADVTAEVFSFLRERIESAEGSGIQRDRIVIDPGFGFGKTLQHNLELLRELRHFTTLGVPVLAGLSRKSMLGALTGQEVSHRLSASVASAVIAVQRGASIVRVHDVRATVDALSVLNAVNGALE
jgi:dihydropteroate synthase